MPNLRSVFSAFRRFGGNGIFTSGLPRNPFSLPNCATALVDPCVSAVRNAVTASPLAMPERSSACIGANANSRTSDRRWRHMFQALCGRGASRHCGLREGRAPRPIAPDFRDGSMPINFRAIASSCPLTSQIAEYYVPAIGDTFALQLPSQIKHGCTQVTERTDETKDAKHCPRRPITALRRSIYKFRDETRRNA